MSKQSVDLFDDPPWPTGLSVAQPTVNSRRLALLASSVLSGLLMISLVLPWFTSAETPQWTPFSHWLDLGWSPGTRNWALLLLGLDAALAVGIGAALWSASKLGMHLLSLVATGLLVVTLLEASAHLTVDPGPNLQADYGAVIGSGAAVLLWVTLAVGPHLSVRR